MKFNQVCSRRILIFCWFCVLEIWCIFDPDYCEAVPERCFVVVDQDKQCLASVSCQRV